MPSRHKSVHDSNIIQHLKAGGVGVVPTDTVYGLACLAADQQAVAKLYKLKKREKKPGTIVAANIQQLVAVGFKKRYLKAVEQYWPGPISVVIPCSDLTYLHQGVGSVAVRIPSDETFRTFLEKTGALLTSSANSPGDSPAQHIEEAERYFGENVDFYADGGDLSGRQASTIIRIVDDAVEVLREGAVNIQEETGKVL